MSRQRRDRAEERALARKYIARNKAGDVVGEITSIRHYTHAVIGGGRVLSWAQSLRAAARSMSALNNENGRHSVFLINKEITQTEAADLGH